MCRERIFSRLFPQRTQMVFAQTTSISGLLRADRVRVGLNVGSKTEAIDHVLKLLRGAPQIIDFEQLREDVHAREAVMSTGVGKGLALPHARSTAVLETLVAFAVTKAPLEFNAHDGEPVRLIFLMVGPEAERAEHVRLLGRISRLMAKDSFRASLVGASDAEAVIHEFHSSEEASF